MNKYHIGELVEYTKQFTYYVDPIGDDKLKIRSIGIPIKTKGRIWWKNRKGNYYWLDSSRKGLHESELSRYGE